MFHDHFMVPSNIENIQKQAEQKFLSLSYQGESKKWTFERFVTAHKEHHTILEGLTDHEYCELDARTKVTCPIDGIKTDSLDTVKAKIMQDRELWRDF